MNKEDARNVIPADHEAEIKEVLTSYYPKFDAAIRAGKDEFEKELPAEVHQDVVDKLLKFVAARTADQINAKFDAKISDWSAQIDAKQGPPRERQARRPRKNSGNSDSSKNRKSKSKKKGGAKKEAKAEERLEEQLRSIMDQVDKRSSSVRFSKDDYASLAEA